MIVIPLVWFVAQSLNVLTVFALSASDPRLWIIAAVELDLSALVLIMHTRSTRLGSRFRAAYRRVLEQTRAPDRALTQAIDTFSSEPPLAVLNRDELTTLGNLFGPLPDPTALADVMEGALRDDDASMLKNRIALESFTEYIANRNGRPSTPVATPSV
jgi:hypothetical protein